ncbi:hypothetical protein Ppa06_57770 [Planomonospora parontospora subsp. parontospora]|uniref:Uncharacterized protein n=2 Tax=Planomonospora parontospora TaxID=58119 RepID=A0AA37BLV1_9ACTN|nr:hypothetical protein [Planomonospora parontospora]GGK90592.1 hypothetical protein GCM10010126_57540 [Planomonospora parontospora]GII11979.1 hypothetical protein Ppa06_57770 [Planomonospora parontospora subsp. parontospora]
MIRLLAFVVMTVFVCAVSWFAYAQYPVTGIVLLVFGTAAFIAPGYFALLDPGAPAQDSSREGER